MVNKSKCLLTIIYLICIQGSNVAIIQNPCSNRILIITSIFWVSYYSHFTFGNLSFFLAHVKINRDCLKMFCSKVLRNSVMLTRRHPRLTWLKLVTYTKKGLRHSRFQNKFLRIAMDLLLKRLSKQTEQEWGTKYHSYCFLKSNFFYHRQFKNGVLGKIGNQCVFEMITTSYYS